MKRKSEDVEFLRALGKAIRTYRTQRSLTQEQLGELAGVNPKYIGEMEKGEKNPTILILHKIVIAYDITLSELFCFNKAGC
jgi:transcriptional regulator with XRE-family HTH domain